MNMFSRSFLFSCVAAVTTHIMCSTTILEKNIDLGIFTKDQKKSITRGFAFTDGKETNETAYFATFAKDKTIFFCIYYNNNIASFDVTELVTTGDNFQKSVTDMITLNIKTSPNVQLFKSLIIALTRRDKKALQQLVDKYTYKAIEDCIITAANVEGTMIPSPDDLEAFDNFLVTADKLTSPVTLEITMDFVTPEILASMAQAIEEEMQ